MGVRFFIEGYTHNMTTIKINHITHKTHKYNNYLNTKKQKNKIKKD